ncbi:MAG TPA: aminotransferase class III-fold pyridoxal phosphate-dependent enzyme [Candidatus Micrarchaeia archaeon]|nr:aminotransferase class III-fold pyridoxal phosphate-dependent enzyme [Candidatus Micrarchaeia archaeon]
MTQTLPTAPARTGHTAHRPDEPATRSRAWRDRDRMVVSPAYSRYTDLVIADGEGVFVTDVDGRRYLDLGCGIAVTSLGHRHPAVSAAVHAQVDSYWHTSVVSQHVRQTEAAERIAGIAPGPLDTVFFANSGAEVVEGAIKLARRASGRPGILVFQGGFHGRTMGAVTCTTSNSHYREGYAPLLPEVYVTPYPYCFGRCDHAPDQACPIAEGRKLEELFEHVVAPSQLAAMLVEPIQGEGGYIVPPAGFLAMLRRVCDRHGILLVCDEVQSGMGRTGRWFAVDHEQVVPDILITAKALGNGLPIGAIVARSELMGVWDPGAHGTTFGGNAVACAAAIAVVDTIEKEGLLSRATAIGERCRSQAETWQAEGSGPADVRGRGAMVGLEFRDAAGGPDADRVADIRAACLQAGVIILSCGLHDNVVRLIPPLVITDAELDRGLEVLATAVRATRR